MSRFFNLIALVAMISSATAAYMVKYDTIFVTEKLRKRESELQREKDAVAILKAEWQLLNRPARLQGLAPPESGMQPLSVRQLANPADLPQAKPEGNKTALEELLLTGTLPDPLRRPPAKAPEAVGIGAVPPAAGGGQARPVALMPPRPRPQARDAIAAMLDSPSMKAPQ